MLQHVNHSVSLFSYVITCADACYRSASLHARARSCSSDILFFFFSREKSFKEKIMIFGFGDSIGITGKIQIYVVPFSFASIVEKFMHTSNSYWEI